MGTNKLASNMLLFFLLSRSGPIRGMHLCELLIPLYKCNFFSITRGNLMHESRNCYIRLYSLTAEVMHNDIIRIIVHAMMCSSPAVAIIERNEECVFIKFQPSRKLQLIIPKVKKDHEIHQISARR